MELRTVASDGVFSGYQGKEASGCEKEEIAASRHRIEVRARGKGGEEQ